ncbi:MAG: hypothetical protein KDA80_08855 [Planctomycetaceae bacterium]|nr:hypothetical protein [Planctomycetaceae bacterium]
MQELRKRVVIGSMVVSAIVALAAIADIALGVPFAGSQTMTMDIIFIICAAIVGYLCWDALKDMG